MSNLDAFINNIPADGFLSLDVFDTAITREVNAPTHLFSVVQKQLIAKYGARRGLPLFGDFPSIRIAAEQASRREGHTSLPETTLDRIYEKLAQNNKKICPYAEEIKALEIETEISGCHPAKEIKECYEKILARSIPVIFVSDMYLPASVIERMLEKCGYRNYKKLFLSSELKKTKHTGEIWREVRRELGDAAKIFHIGDNKFADVITAEKNGVTAFHFPKYSQSAKHYFQFSTGIIPLSRLNSLEVRAFHAQPENANATLHEPDDNLETLRKIGSTYLSLMFGSFIKWISEQTAIHSAKTIHFLARDGWILKKTWERLAAEGFLDPEITPVYAEVSRRALWIPSLRQLDRESLLFLTGGIGANRPLRTFIERIGLELDSGVIEKIKKHFPSSDATITNRPSQNAQIWSLLCDLEPEILAAAARQRDTAIGYLEKIGLAGTPDKVVVVDLGWRASIQSRLIKLLEEKEPLVRNRIVGLYCGLFDHALQFSCDAGYTQGMICTPFTAFSLQKELKTTVPLLETFHLAPHGSVTGYEKRENGEIHSRQAENPAEIETYLRYVKPIQESAIESLVRMLKTNVIAWEDLGPGTYLETWKDLALCPNWREVKILGQIDHWDSFEHIGKGNPLVPEAIPASPKDALKILKQSSNWQAGTLANWIHRKIFPKETLRQILNTTHRLPPDSNARTHLNHLINNPA